MKHFQRDNVIHVTVSEMNEHLDYVRKNFYKIIEGKRNPDVPLLRCAYVEDKLVNFELTYRKGSHAATYICRKDSQEETQKIDGMEAFRILNLYYKVPHMPEKYCGRADEGALSASPLVWYNPKHEGTWNYAYAYDMNSAYSYAMLQNMPDTSQPIKAKKIMPGKEIGFREVINDKTNNMMLIPVYSGFSLYVFPLMESPFKKFVEKWYSEKKNAPKGSFAREKAKNVLNYSVGYLQRVNPFLRAAIVGYCNNLMTSLIDKNTTLMCNTDSIISLKPLPLKIGDEVGEWKLEKEGEFAFKGSNYQWKDGETCFRGIPKSWFKPDFDITKDELPKFGNVYIYKRGKIVLNENI